MIFLKGRAFLIITAFLIVSNFSYSQSKDCEAQFTAREEISQKISISNFISKYKGQKGYLEFTDSLTMTKSMDYLYSVVSEILTKSQMTLLKWQQFQGTVAEFNSLKDKILNTDNTVKTEFVGMRGYATFAEKYYENDMLKTYINVSAVLTKSQMTLLKWQSFHGTVAEFNSLKDKILNTDKTVKTKFFGIDGYATFAEKYYENNMKKTYLNVSAVLTKSQMTLLKWQQFHGTVAEFNSLTDKILNTDNTVKTEFVGIDGYATFAEKYYENDMKKTYTNVSAVLTKSQMTLLKWQQFHGTIAEFNSLRDKILNTDKTVKTKFVGIDGYATFAEKYYENNMLKTYTNVSAVLTKSQMTLLKWQSFHGTVAEFNSLRDKILNTDNTVKTEFVGMRGYATFAEKYYENNMLKTYLNVSAVLTKSQMTLLKWQQFKGTVAEFNSLRDKILNTDKILDTDKTVKTEFVGIDGYPTFAEKYYENNMLKTYLNVSAVLTKSQMTLLKWQSFHGTVAEFNSLRDKILNTDNTVKTEFVGIDGYPTFAEKYYENNMLKAYLNVSAVLTKSQMTLLKWQSFHGTVAEFNSLKDKILNTDKTVKTEFVGIDGYATFAEKYYENNMLKAYTNVSAVLGGFHTTRELGLGWKSFQGTVSQYEKLENLFKDYSKEKNKKKFKGDRGQEKVAQEIFEGNLSKAYRNVSILRVELLGSQEAFTELNWKKP